MNKHQWSRERVAVTWFVLGWLGCALAWWLTLLLDRAG